MQQRGRLIVMFAVFVLALCLAAFFGGLWQNYRPGRSITAAAAPPDAPGVPLPCGHPLASFEKDRAPTSQVGVGHCIHGHNYIWIHEQWKAGIGGPEFSPNVPHGPTTQDLEEAQRRALEAFNAPR